MAAVQQQQQPPINEDAYQRRVQTGGPILYLHGLMIRQLFEGPPTASVECVIEGGSLRICGWKIRLQIRYSFVASFQYNRFCCMV